MLSARKRSEGAYLEVDNAGGNKGLWLAILMAAVWLVLVSKFSLFSIIAYLNNAKMVKVNPKIVKTSLNGRELNSIAFDLVGMA